MDEQQYNDEQDGGGDAQIDGAFARVNGGMLQSGRFTNHIVSLVGQVTAHDTIRSADGSNVHVITEHLAGDDEEGGAGGGLIVDPNTVVEIMGQASGPTEITVRCLFVLFVFVYGIAALRRVSGLLISWFLALCLFSRTLQLILLLRMYGMVCMVSHGIYFAAGLCSPRTRYGHGLGPLQPNDHDATPR